MNACRLEAEVALSKAMLLAKNEKEVAVEKALQVRSQLKQDKPSTIIVSKPEIKKVCSTRMLMQFLGYSFNTR